MENKAGSVPILELQLAVQIDMSRHRTDPAHLRTDNRNRFAVDHRLQRDFLDHAGFGKARSTTTDVLTVQRPVLAELLFRLAQLVDDRIPLGSFVFQQIFEARALLHQGGLLAQQFDFFQPAQRPQAHVQNRVGLDFG